MSLHLESACYLHFSCYQYGRQRLRMTPPPTLQDTMSVIAKTCKRNQKEIFVWTSPFGAFSPLPPTSVDRPHPSLAYCLCAEVNDLQCFCFLCNLVAARVIILAIALTLSCNVARPAFVGYLNCLHDPIRVPLSSSSFIRTHFGGCCAAL